MFAAAPALGLDQHARGGADTGVHECSCSGFTGRTQACRTLLAQRLGDRWHAGGRRSRPFGIGEDMEPGQATIGDMVECVLEHLVCLGRETCNQVGAKYGIGPQASHGFAERHGLFGCVSALHAFENHRIPGLQ